MRSNVRMIWFSSLFIPNAPIVARATAVMPMIFSPDHLK